MHFLEAFIKEMFIYFLARLVVVKRGFNCLIEDRIERYSMEDNIRGCDSMHDMHH